MSSAASSSSAAVDGNNNNNNPLLKIWCIQRVLLFVKQNGIIVDSASSSAQQQQSSQTTNLASIPRLLQLKNVTSSWNETVEFYIHHIPSAVVIEFCHYLFWNFVKEKHSKSEKHATLARDAFLWISRFIGDSKSVEKFSSCVHLVINDNLEVNIRIFGTEQIRDALVAMAEFVTTAASVRDWCSVIIKLTEMSLSICQQENAKVQEQISLNRKLFGINEIYRSLLTMSKFVSDSYSVDNFCNCISQITFLEENQKLFATVELRDVMTTIYRFIEDRFEADSWLQVIDNLTKKNKLFDIDSVRDIQTIFNEIPY